MSCQCFFPTKIIIMSSLPHYILMKVWDCTFCLVLKMSLIQRFVKPWTTSTFWYICHIWDFSANFSFCNGSKGALLTYRVLCLYFIQYDERNWMVVLCTKKNLVWLSLESCKTKQTAMKMDYSKILNNTVYTY